MEKRVVLFLILSLAIIFAYDFILKELGIIPEAPPVETERSGEAGPFKEAPPETVAQSTAGESSPSASTGTALSPGAVDSAAPGDQLIAVETDLYRAELTNRGGEIRSWRLKKHLTQDRDHPEPVQLIHTDGQFAGPLAVKTSDTVLTKRLEEGLYQVDKDFSSLDARHPSGNVTFRYRDQESGVSIKKTLTFHYDRYLIDVDVSTDGLSDPFEIGLGTNFGIVEWGEGFIGLIGSAWVVNDQLEKKTPEAVRIEEGDVRWVALQDKYFISVLMPRTKADAIVAERQGDKLVSAGLRYQPGPNQTASLRLYAGPKEFDTLKAFHIGLEDTIDFGWFIYGSWGIVKAVAKPLFSVLRFLYEYTHNYGLSIILLTLGIKLLFVPLQYKSYKSMKDMQGLQPKVAALQTKYKDNKEQLNKELIKLYREHRVNPLGGCLPMVVQMPVFVALFNILYMTIDLRRAPFILWISDLSVQDPFYVLPVLMGASMVLQQKIMPTAMDPTQAKLMLLLPAFLTIVFLTFPAGLVLYWLTNNLLTILQQVVTDRFIFKRPTFVQAQPAEEQAPSEKEGRAQETGKGGGKKKKERDQDKGRSDKAKPEKEGKEVEV